MIGGRVQGVFFRDSLRRLAEQHGVAGWAHNTAEGTVEAVFEGEPSAVDVLVTLCHKGPRGARVDRVEELEEDLEGLRGFSVR